MKKNSQKEALPSRVSLRVPEPLLKDLQDIADSEHRNLSNTLVMLLHFGVPLYKKKTRKRKEHGEQERAG